MTHERHTLSQLGEEQGWAHRETDRTDVYTRGPVRIRVIWQDHNAISGASYFQNNMYETYTRELTKVHTWLKR